MIDLDEGGVTTSSPEANRALQRAKISFKVHMEPDKRRTIREGRPISRAIDMLIIEIPGRSAQTVPYDPASHLAYAHLYAKWKAGEEIPTSGTPLKDWGVLSADDLRSILDMGFLTVEQLADPAPEGERKLGALLSWSREAKRFLAARDVATPKKVAALEAEIETMKSLVQNLERQNYLLCQRIEANEGVRLLSDEQRVRLSTLEVVKVSENGSVTPVATGKRGRPKKLKTSEPTLDELT